MAGKSVEIVGISVPVWLTEDITSEPAVEVFCRYHLFAPEGVAEVATMPEGYQINLPNEKRPQCQVSLEQWRGMSFMEQEEWYNKHRFPPQVRALRNISDGGGAYLRFEFRDETVFQEKEVELVHYVTLNTIDYLMGSLV